MDFLEQRLSAAVPPRCSLHQCIKSNSYDPADPSRRCICCFYYHLNLSSQTCRSCLTTEHLDRFKADKQIKDELWYQFLQLHEGD